MSGVEALMGAETSTERAIVQIADGGTRAKLAVIKEEFNRGGELHGLLLGYTRSLMGQIAQTAACNASHTVEERLTRWLLMCHDRIDSEVLKLTQEFISEMLGTRRATVSVAAMALQVEGLIQYNRGHIKIVDRKGLESFGCECYRALNGS
jgi:CRP-like cAMP-binding protein